MFVQNRIGRFVKVRLPQSEWIRSWRNVRVARVTGDRRKDLIVVEGRKTEKAYLRIFRGQQKAPYFDFRYVASLKCLLLGFESVLRFSPLLRFPISDDRTFQSGCPTRHQIWRYSMATAMA